MFEKSEAPSSEHGIYWIKHPDLLVLDLSWKRFAVFEMSAEELNGQSLYQQFETDPLSAYKMIKQMLGAVARGVAFNTVTVDNCTFEYTDTEDAMSQSRQAATTLIDSLPDGAEPFNFQLRAYPSRADVENLGADPAARTVLLEARVEPHNLAF